MKPPCFFNLYKNSYYLNDDAYLSKICDRMYGNGSQFMYLSHQTLQFPKVEYRCQHAFKVRGWQHRA